MYLLCQRINVRQSVSHMTHLEAHSEAHETYAMQSMQLFFSCLQHDCITTIGLYNILFLHWK